MRTPRQPHHDDSDELGHEPSHDGLGPVPHFTPAQRAAARSVLLAHVEDDLRAREQTTAVSGGLNRRTARPVISRPTAQSRRPSARALHHSLDRSGAHRRSWARRGILAGAGTVSAAALTAAAVYLGGGFDDLTGRGGTNGTGSVLAGREPALPMSAVAYTLPSAAATTDRAECTTRRGSTADGDGLRYLLDETTGGTAGASGSALPPLTSSMVRTDTCFTSGWPAASFIATTADGRHLTQAITVWGPGVDGLAAPSRGHAVRATAVGAHPARVLLADWSVLASWSTPEGT